MGNFEFIILTLFFIFQVALTLSIIQSAITMKRVFLGHYSLINTGDQVDDDTEKANSKSNNYALTSTSKNEHFIILKNTINTYLQRNSNAIVDFHILKDIVDRTLETVEGAISNRLSAPLYLGLVATMFGIITGLWSIKGSTINLEHITPFLTSIKWAMSVSITGLIFTLVLSVFVYRKNKEILDADKNVFLSFLQAELLPKVSKSNSTEVAKLNQRLDEFSRQSLPMIDKLKTIVQMASTTVLHEQELIEKVNQLDIKKVSTINANIFSKLSKMMDSFQAFPMYYQELNSSLQHTSALNRNLLKLIEHKELIPETLNKIGNIIENTKTSTDFFNENIVSFERYSGAIQQSVANADDKMQEAIDQLTKAITRQLETYQLAAANYQEKIELSFDKSISKYTDTVDRQVMHMQQAFESAQPKFEKIDEIQSGLDRLNENLLAQTEILKIKHSEKTQLQLPATSNEEHNALQNFILNKPALITLSFLFVLFVATGFAIKYLF